MKTTKVETKYWIWYRTDNGILHGFYNNNDEYIGYHYQNFWLIF
jgi:hypothetical protein